MDICDGSGTGFMLLAEGIELEAALISGTTHNTI